MPHSYLSVRIHFVFATKHRAPYLTKEIRDRLWQYLGGLCRQKDIESISIGGFVDHCHTLISLPSTMSVAIAAKYLKGASSRWLSQTFPELPDFRWQKGYGAFSVSISHIATTVAYINNQEEHHKGHSFEDEYADFLTRHQIPFDKNNIWHDDEEEDDNTSEGQNDT